MNAVVALFATGSRWLAGVPSREQPLWTEHAAFVDDLVERSVLLLGGPLREDRGALMVFDGDRSGDVTALLHADPWIAHDVFRIALVARWDVYVDRWSR